MSFSELLEQGKQAKVREHKDITVLVNGEPVVLRVHELPSYDWAALTTKHPPRPGATADWLGYNVTAASLDALEHEAGLSVVEGEKVSKVTAKQWQTLREILSGVEVGNLADAAFWLNDWLPRNRIVEAKKASAGDSKKSSSSPANSESPSEG